MSPSSIVLSLDIHDPDLTWPLLFAPRWRVAWMTRDGKNHGMWPTIYPSATAAADAALEAREKFPKLMYRPALFTPDRDEPLVPGRLAQEMMLHSLN